MVIIETISRLVPGVVAKEESVKNESFSNGSNLEYPQYTRPEKIKLKIKNSKLKILKVPSILLSGNHKKIEEWRAKSSK